jgi:hypothetical protein
MKTPISNPVGGFLFVLLYPVSSQYIYNITLILRFEESRYENETQHPLKELNHFQL